MSSGRATRKYVCFACVLVRGDFFFKKYGNRPFKVATMLRWTVVVSDPQQMLEIANAAEEDLSFREVMKDVRPIVFFFLFGRQMLTPLSR